MATAPASLDQQMIMIGHETVSVTDPAEARDNVRESLQKELAVSIGEKDFLASVAAAGQIIDRAGKLQANAIRRLYRADLYVPNPPPRQRSPSGHLDIWSFKDSDTKFVQLVNSVPYVPQPGDV